MTAKSSLLEELKQMGINEKILSAIKSVNRELFISPAQAHLAYENIPLPIGSEQTISQPYTVAFMIQLLEIHPEDKILEVGAGSGYNAAVMSQLTGEKGKIISVELVAELAKQARDNLKKAGITNVKVIHGNGYLGYAKEAPFDKIIVTAGASETPPALIEQLKENGILVIPINRGWGQVMTKIMKKEGRLIASEHGEFSFVPLKHE
ncbi:protein-L-isoaspartate(D-aspartate) O-methyltransferase [Candidatus Woesearchaeota archaeon]|nr:protein-L-isoaspartate(D-aspartate) O-methyltransferase [Candidatus Woesearchaeota archaeon]